MSFFDLINPFSYATPLHADGSESAPAIASEAVVVVEAEAAAEVEEAAEEVEAEAEEAEEEEEEEEEEAEDHAPAIKEGCAATMSCKSARHHYDACAARVDAGATESCAEELLHFMECVDGCAAEKIFAKLK